MNVPPPPPWSKAEPRRLWMREEEFAPWLSRAGGSMVVAAKLLLQDEPSQWVERRLSFLAEEASTVERFLDGHGARENQCFYPIRKGVACTLWLSRALASLVHLRGRLQVYPTADSTWTEEQLPRCLAATVDELGFILIKVLQHLEEQWVKAGCEWSGRPPQGSQEERPPSRVLVANRSGAEIQPEGREDSLAARLASRYLRILQSWSEDASTIPEGAEAQKSFVESFCRERITRAFQTRVHSWQSDYDSQIRGSLDEQCHPEWGCLRGAMSQALHLLEATTALAHLFERHRPGMEFDPDGELGSFLEDPPFLQAFLKGCVAPARRCLKVAEGCAEKILQSLTERTYKDLEVPKGVQLHARPLSLIVATVLHYGLPVTMGIEGEEAQADSLIRLLLLAGSHPDARTVRFEGDSRVLSDLEALFAGRLGEDGVDKLSSQLHYLKK